MSKELKCIVSPQYSKDNYKTIHFYCDYCGKEMCYREDRICLAEREKCPHCLNDIGDCERSAGVCFKCDKEI